MRIQVRVTEVFLRRLDALADARGMNRSQAIRAAVSEASPSASIDLPPALERDELLRLLGEAARGGSVSAMRRLLEEYRRDSGAPRHRPAFIDELARRRASGS